MELRTHRSLFKRTAQLLETFPEGVAKNGEVKILWDVIRILRKVLDCG